MSNSRHKDNSAQPIVDIATALNISKRSAERRAAREGWMFTEEQVRGGIRRLYPVDSLPASVREAVVLRPSGATVGQRMAAQASIQRVTKHAQQENGLINYLKLNEGARTKASARATVLYALQEWAKSKKIKIGRAAINEFCELFNAKKINTEDWARDIVGTVSWRTVYRWQQKLVSEGLAGLAPDYKGQAGKSLIDQQPELRDWIVSLLSHNPHATSAHLVSACNARFGNSKIEIPSKRRIEVWVNGWKRDNAEVFTAVTNPDAWKNSYMTAFGSASADVCRLNQRWELDSTPADLMLLDGRYHIIGAMDVYSRRPRLLVSKTSKSTAVGQLLRRCLLDWGVPEQIKTDNGSDYISRYIRQFITSLDIEQSLCDPFSGWQKPHIERFFRTFSHDLVELLPGYIGHNVTDRQAIEARHSFSDRLFKKDQIIDVSMSAADLQKFCDEWVNNIYMHREHRGDSMRGESPFERIARWKSPVRRIANERALDVLLAEAPDTGVRTVTKSGLRIDRITYIAAELSVYVGTEVRVAYTEDLGRVMVFNDDGFLCIAEAPEYTGINRQEVAAHAREKQKDRVQEARRELKGLVRKLNTKEAADEIMRASQQNVTALPHRGEDYNTGGLQHAARAAEADKPMTASPLNDDQREAMDAVKKDLASAKPVPVHRSPKQEYEHWLRLDRRVQSGHSLPERDAAFHKHYPLSADYAAMKDMYEEFGLGISEA